MPPFIAEYTMPNTQNATAAISADVMEISKASGKINQLRFMLITVPFIRNYLYEHTRALLLSVVVSRTVTLKFVYISGILSLQRFFDIYTIITSVIVDDFRRDAMFFQIFLTADDADLHRFLLEG